MYLSRGIEGGEGWGEGEPLKRFNRHNPSKPITTKNPA
jgi:hypothetical protein